ncbi:MAG: DNRLRE domain-containing protein, partial [Chloroflexi bacterium]|nr:DNRLRE domain-containing protein [Chloroflexota bacterium]
MAGPTVTSPRPKGRTAAGIGGAVAIGVGLAAALLFGAPAPAANYEPGVYAGQDSQLQYVAYSDTIPLQGAYGRFQWDQVQSSANTYGFSVVTTFLDKCAAHGVKCGVTIAPSVDGGNYTMKGYPSFLNQAQYNPVLWDGKYYVNYANANVKNQWFGMIDALGTAIKTHSALSWVSVGVGCEGEPNVWRYHDNDKVEQAYRSYITKAQWQTYVQETLFRYRNAFSYSDVNLFYLYSGYYGNSYTDDSLRAPLLQYAASLGMGGDLTGLRPFDRVGDTYGGVGNSCADPGLADWAAPLCFSDTINFQTEFSWRECHWGTYWAILNGLTKGHKIIRPLWSILVQNGDSACGDNRTWIDAYNIVEFAEQYAPYAGDLANLMNSPGVWVALKSDPFDPPWYYPFEGDYEFGLYHDRNAVQGAPTYRSAVAWPDGRGWVSVRTDSATDNHYLYFRVDDRWAYSATQSVTVTVWYFDEGTDAFDLEYDAGAEDAYHSAGAHTKTGANTWLAKEWVLTDAVFGNNQDGGYDLRLFNMGDGDDTFHMVEIERISGEAPPSPTPTHTSIPGAPTNTATHTKTSTPTATGPTPTPTHSPTPTTTWTPTPTGTPYAAGGTGQDTTIDRWNPSANYGATSANDLRRYSGDGDVESILVEFNLADVPPLATIEDAQLKMYATYRTGTGVITATVYSISATWNAAWATWEKRDAADNWGTAGANGAGVDIASDATDALGVNGIGQWYAWDVTTAVQAWVDGAANHGLKVEATDGVDALMRFASFEYADPALRPRLDISYAPTGPTATPTHTPTAAPVSRSISASADDADQTGATRNVDRTSLYFLYNGYEAGLRFGNVAVGQGAEISSAVLTVYGFDGDGTGTVRAEAYDNCAAYTASDGPGDRNVGNASVSWDPPTFGYHTAYTVSVTSLVQEVVDRANWASGNAL